MNLPTLMPFKVSGPVFMVASTYAWIVEDCDGNIRARCHFDSNDEGAKRSAKVDADLFAAAPVLHEALVEVSAYSVGRHHALSDKLKRARTVLAALGKREREP